MRAQDGPIVLDKARDYNRRQAISTNEVSPDAAEVAREHRSTRTFAPYASDSSALREISSTSPVPEIFRYLGAPASPLAPHEE